MRFVTSAGLAAALLLSTAPPARAAPPSTGSNSGTLTIGRPPAAPPPQPAPPPPAASAPAPASPPPAAKAPAPVRAIAGGAPVVLDGLSVVLGQTRVTVPHIEARGTELSPERLRALLDPDAPLSPGERLDGLTAVSLTAPSVTLRDVDGAGPDLAIEGVALTDVVRGSVGALSIGAVRTGTPGAPGSAGLATVESVRATEIDLPLALRIATAGRDDPAEAPRVLLGSLAIGPTSTPPQDGTAVAFRGFALGGLRARPLLRAPAELAALADKPKGELTPDERRDAIMDLLDAVGSVSLEHLGWDGLAVRTLGMGGDRSEVGVARLSIDGLSPTQIRSLSVDGLTWAAPREMTSLEHLSLRGPDESPLVAYAIRRLVADGDAAAAGPPPALPPQEASASLLGLRVHVPSGPNPGNSPDGRSIDVAVPVASLTGASDRDGRVRSSLHLRMEAPVPAAASLPDAAVLRDAGVDALRTSLDAALSADPGSRDLNLDALSLAADGLGSFATTLALGDVPSTLSPDAGASAGRDVTLRRVEVRYVDAGLADMALPMMARAAGTSVPLFKALIKTRAQLLIGQAMGVSEAAVRLVTAVNAFVDDPRSFTLTVTAPGGLKAGEVQDAPDPSALAGRVTVEAVANR